MCRWLTKLCFTQVFAVLFASLTLVLLGLSLTPLPWSESKDVVKISLWTICTNPIDNDDKPQAASAGSWACVKSL